MIAEEPLFVDINSLHWTRLVELFRQREKQAKIESIALVITRDGHAVKAVHSQRGAVRGFTLPASGDLAEVAAMLQADRVGVCDVDAFQNIYESAQRALFYDQDLVQQFLSMYQAGVTTAREEIRWYPTPPLKFRKTNYKRIQRVFHRLIPDGRTIVFAVFHEGEVYTSLILGKQKGDISLMTTFDGVDLAGFDASEWKQQAPLLLERISKKHGKVFLGAFFDLRTLDEMRAGNRPLRFLREAGRRGAAVIRPLPFRLRFAIAAVSKLKRL